MSYEIILYWLLLAVLLAKFAANSFIEHLFGGNYNEVFALSSAYYDIN